MLLEYTGGRTGRHYTFPVGYFSWDDGDVLAFSSQQWPAHIRHARGVRLLIRGRWHATTPTVISDKEAKADLLAEFVRRKGASAARGLMLGLPGNRLPARSELLAAASKTTITRFTLITSPDRQTGSPAPGDQGPAGPCRTHPPGITMTDRPGQAVKDAAGGPQIPAACPDEQWRMFAGDHGRLAQHFSAPG